VRKLSAFALKNTTRRALWEYDHILRSLYLLDYIDSAPLRRNVQRALNRGENYHQLRRAVSYANFGKLRFKTEHDQQIWGECARLITNCIIYYNTRLLSDLLDYKETEEVARSLRLELYSLEVSTGQDLDRAFATLTSQRAQAFIVTAANVVMFGRRAEIARFAQSSRLPSMYAAKEYVDVGGLMSYGPSVPGMFRRAAVYVDKILKGAKPGDLPVEQPTKFELVINLKTAKALGLTIPQSILVRADEVIQ